MAGPPRVICAGADLRDGGRGVRFEIARDGRAVQAFAVRCGGLARAYVNRCTHVAVELDWQPGVFYDAAGLYLLCSMHGASYDAATGACVGGPCRGRGLEPLAVREEDGRILLEE
ncbi:MAG: Rieske 2Fe-2S domain-containing protein [Burkholderiales bacterium]|nr:Rieske 2Fe-2S domain-containing protein [Burkholderiales bacterium]